ncbi:MAG TPA: helix-turn-helix domain-containing protein, partial [Kiritimatiellia bacterium]|nr:helix-turn-helix domain-containing protein [Kiritimatiellia bacterium]HRU71450.1 helix-turn-helix domain-containing protein [Kiritimatiellia bacterium]
MDSNKQHAVMQGVAHGSNEIARIIGRDKGTVSREVRPGPAMADGWASRRLPSPGIATSGSKSRILRVARLLDSA